MESTAGHGDPRSLTKTNGEVSLSEPAQGPESSPRRGWVLGVPFLTRRTCSTAALNSTWSRARDRAGGSPLYRNLYCSPIASQWHPHSPIRFWAALLVAVTHSVPASLAPAAPASSAGHQHRSHRVHTMRWSNNGTGTSSGHGSALKIARWWHCQQHTSSDRTSRACCVIGSIGSMMRLAAIRRL